MPLNFMEENLRLVMPIKYLYHLVLPYATFPLHPKELVSYSKLDMSLLQYEQKELILRPMLLKLYEKGLKRSPGQGQTMAGLVLC